MKSSISQGLDTGEERINTIEDIPLETIQTEMQRKIREVREDGEEDILEQIMVKCFQN